MTKNILFFCLVLYQSVCYSQDTICIVDNNISVTNLENSKMPIYYFMDSTGLLTFTDILNKIFKQEIPSDEINANCKTNSIWSRIIIKNCGVKYRQFVIRGNASMQDNFVLSLFDTTLQGNIELKNGSLEPDSLNNIRFHASILLPFYLDINQVKTIYINRKPAKVSSYDEWHSWSPGWIDSPEDNFYISPVEPIIKESLKTRIIDGVVIGFLLIMGIYHLVLFIRLRWKEYFYFCIYCFACFLFYFTFCDYQYEWWGNIPLLHSLSFALVLICAYLGLVLNYGNIKEIYPKWYKTISIGLWYCIALLIITIVGRIGIPFLTYLSKVLIYNDISSFWVFASVLICIGIVLVPYLRLAFKKDTLAIYFLLATLLLLIPFYYLFLAVYWNNIYAKNAFEIGFPLQMLIFALGLAEKMHIINKQKINTQKELISQLHVNSEMQLKANLELEQKVKERTFEISHQKEELQTTLEHLKLTQAELIQSEKMASLGQLIAGIAHEINTPLGAINASISTISDSSQQSIKLLPALVKVLSDDELKLFMELVNLSAINNNSLSSKEEREYRKKIATQLQNKGIAEADDFADLLVDMGIYNEIENYLPLIKTQIIQAAYHLSMQIKNSNNIKMAIDRASKVVFALKNYARYGNEQNMVEANIVDGLETVLTLYQNQMKHGITLHKEFEKVPPILCYPDELNQVWTNLIHNAIYAMDGKGELSISVSKNPKGFENLSGLAETHGRASVQIRISDIGKGIPPEIKDRIFDAFFTTKPAGEGSGLGLYIVKQIVDKHKGTIAVESEVGKGTAFIVELPIDH